MRRGIGFLSAAALAAFPGVASASDVMISVTNNQPTGGFTFSPVWFAFHDGSFDAFDAGSAAAMGIENVAELANAAALGMEFAASGASGVAGLIASGDALPPFTPGESASMMFDAGDGATNRYFSYASMLVPSNDFFFGNDAPMGVEIFDAAGNFLGPRTIQVFSDGIWDAGTEVNDALNGPAFIVGQDATAGADENGVVHLMYSSAGIDAYLASLVGVQTPIGPLTDPLVRGELIATITIVPEPASAFGLLMAGAALRGLRRR
ncbi:MAG: hypothetical protein AMXMBFR47_41100 [Planctomycetota bacterium]